ncbi:MAG TPA: protease inhibitor I42 family protein [Terriglobia bacterium]|nr:protease inhibitor I42 family protein [Terriglobia bacterium]
MLVLDEHSNSQTIGAILGQELEIRLQENPTAGFRWRFVQTGEPVCTLLSDRFDPGREAPGQAGVHSWKFKAITEGTATIKLVYCRSWENVTDAARSFACSLSVRQ